ncbi:MAG: prepilin peptidase [Armatimonadota bacterium]
MPVSWPITVAVFVVGLAIGSFLNVVIYRLPRCESIVRSRSRCLSCGTRLGILDLIPVLSYIVSGGKCRHCGRPYSPRYMIVELMTGVLAVASLFIIGPNLYAATVFILSCMLIVIFFIDIDWLIIPDELVAGMIVIGLALNAVAISRAETGSLVHFREQLGYATTHTVPLPSGIVGMLVGAALFYAVGWTFERILNKPSLGGGDVKLAAAMGAILGPGYQFLSFFLYAVFAGAIIGLVMLAVTAKSERQSYIPFGPMLAASGIAMLLFPQELTGFVIGIYS